MSGPVHHHLLVADPDPAGAVISQVVADEVQPLLVGARGHRPSFPETVRELRKAEPTVQSVAQLATETRTIGSGGQGRSGGAVVTGIGPVNGEVPTTLNDRTR
ncbi:hypothetical protein GCM10012279_51070 [Micromonospora yangpuensis]|nr:hypothetical protein GCM10012279_51070 [Micromonospora yangpuensis]